MAQSHLFSAIIVNVFKSYEYYIEIGLEIS